MCGLMWDIMVVWFGVGVVGAGVSEEVALKFGIFWMWCGCSGVVEEYCEGSRSGD